MSETHETPSDTPNDAAASPAADTPTVGLAEAARMCGVSKPTIRRRAPELIAFGAVQSDQGWSIPVTALVAVGLCDSVTPGGSTTGAKKAAVPGKTGSASPGVASPVDPGELDRVRAEAAEWQRRAEVAEAVAAERERRVEAAEATAAALDRVIEAQALALRVLEAPRPPVTPAQEQQALLPTRSEVPEQVTTGAKRRWWRSA